MRISLGEPLAVRQLPFGLVRSLKPTPQPFTSYAANKYAVLPKQRENNHHGHQPHKTLLNKFFNFLVFGVYSEKMYF